MALLESLAIVGTEFPLETLAVQTELLFHQLTLGAPKAKHHSFPAAITSWGQAVGYLTISTLVDTRSLSSTIAKESGEDPCIELIATKLSQATQAKTSK